MASIRRPSVRLWQTELFVIVIVVAILILSVSLSRGLQTTLKRLGETEQLGDASALAVQIRHEFPLTVESRARIREHVNQFRLIYHDDVWVYDIDGSIVHTENNGGPPEEVLEEARIQGLADSPPYTRMTLERNGYAVAGKAVYDDEGRRAGTVVISGPVAESVAVLDAVRSRLWATFWVALIVAGLLGLGFSEIIGRRVRLMTQAAAAIASGDFEQRLPTGLVPDEIFELAESYNKMAVTLGETFSALREREQEIAGVIESMGEGVAAFDFDGGLRVINPEALDLLGLERDLEGAVELKVTDLSDNEVLVRLVDQALHGDRAAQVAVLGDRTVLLHGTPITSVGGSVAGAVLIMADVTEQKRLEEAQRRFVANASHELRTPISALKGLLELLTSGAKDDPRVRDDFLRTMALEVDRLGRLVADLLTLAQLDAGGLALNRQPVSVTDLLGDVATVMHALAEEDGVTLAVDVPPGGYNVDCDRDRLMQVLIGFVDNALKHSAQGGTVTLRAIPHDATITLEVQDDGVGIDPALVPRLFERFFRIDESRAAPRSTGLGLSIAKEIVEAHGSVIEVESQLNEGARFRFDLPMAP